MIFKGLFAVGAGIAGACAVSETIAREVDQRFWRPVRNYHTSMVQQGTFNMPEDLVRYSKEFRDGFKPKPDLD